MQIFGGVNTSPSRDLPYLDYFIYTCSCLQLNQSILSCTFYVLLCTHTILVQGFGCFLLALLSGSANTHTPDTHKHFCMCLSRPNGTNTQECFFCFIFVLCQDVVLVTFTLVLCCYGGYSGK